MVHTWSLIRIPCQVLCIHSVYALGYFENVKMGTVVLLLHVSEESWPVTLHPSLHLFF